MREWIQSHAIREIELVALSSTTRRRASTRTNMYTDDGETDGWMIVIAPRTASSAAKGRVLGGLEEFIDAEKPSRDETPSALEVRFYVARARARGASRMDGGL